MTGQPAEPVAQLRGRWPQLLHDHVELRERLLAAYSDPARGYHTTRHLGEMLDRIQELAEAGSAGSSGAGTAGSAGSAGRAGSAVTAGRPLDEEALILAAWFHDAVYDERGDNEERSALLAERELATAGVPPTLVSEVARLVRLTAGSTPAQREDPEAYPSSAAVGERTAADLAGDILRDADHAILAAPSGRYDDYAAGVRHEHPSLSDEEFRAGRAAFLAGLLHGGQPVFRTAHGRMHWEAPARDNAARELAALRGAGLRAAAPPAAAPRAAAPRAADDQSTTS